MKKFSLLLVLIIALAAAVALPAQPAYGGLCQYEYDTWTYYYGCCSCSHVPPQTGDRCWCEESEGLCYANIYGGIFCIDNQGVRAEGGS